MIKVKVGKKAPVMEKKKQLNELEPDSMVIGALLMAAFKYLGPLIGKLLQKIGVKLEAAQEETKNAIEQAKTIPEEQKNDILEKLNAADAKLKQTLEIVKKQAASVEAAKAMPERPSAMVAKDIEAYNQVITEAKALAAKEKAVLEALDKAEKAVADVAKEIASLDMTAAIGSMKDPKGLYATHGKEIKIADEDKWIQFASIVAKNAKSAGAAA